MFIKIIKLFLLLNTLIFSTSFAAEIWKSDGSIVDENDNIKKESFGVRFQKELILPTSDWPKASSASFPINNYFGNNLFLPGTPLLRFSGIDFGSNYLKKLSEINGFNNIEELQKYIISNANRDFLKKLKITEDQAINFVSTKNSYNNPENMENEYLDLLNKKIKKQILEKQKIINDKLNQKLAKNLEQNFEQKIQDEIKEQVQDQVEEQVQDQVYNSLNKYFDKLEADYKAKGWTVCSRTDDRLTASSSSEGCTGFE